MSHVSDFTQADKDVLTALILYDNPELVLTSDQVDYLDPSPITGNRNTTITVAPRSTSEYTGRVQTTYDRLNVQDFINLFEPDGLELVSVAPVALSRLITEINAMLGIALTDLDYVDQEIPAFSEEPGASHQVTVAIRPGSLLYMGSFTFTVRRNDISLLNVISVTHLTGLNMPVVE